MNQVLMEHPALDGRVIKVADTAVPIHMASGWRVVEGKKAEGAALTPSDEEGAASGSKSTRRPASKE